LVGLTVTVATGTGLTVITGVGAEVADSLIAVIVAVPTPTAVTVVVPLVPLAGFTVNTAVLLDAHVTVRPLSTLLAASCNVDVSCWVPPTTIGVVGAESVTVVTGASDTVIEAVPILASLVAVIVVPPAPIALTRPFPSTVATASSLDFHVTTRPVSVFPLPSFVAALSCCFGVTPSTTVADEGLTVTVATGTGLTTIVGVVAPGPDSIVAVIVPVPGLTAVTVTVAPLDVLTELDALTVNTEGLLETQVTVRPSRFTPFASLGIAVTNSVPPTVIGVVGADSVTAATGTGSIVIETLEVIPPAEALTVVEPAARATRLPP
jgi:hypothetical protein